ncbi:MAG: citronellyl-CoA dehydrogenase [Bacteroidetes bacterium]|nr:citronellyl-CoA dehydrogenase [Bacteroidota bacterium]
MAHQYFTEEHELFRQSVRQFINSEVRPYIEQWESDRKVPREVFLKMASHGFLGINFPEAYGGTDNDFWYTVVYLEEINRAGFAGIAAAVSVHQYMATNHIAMAGNEALKRKYLPKAIAGEWIGSIAITEAGAGSDVANIRTTAVRDGDDYIINGSKTFITNGVYGNFVTVACKTDPAAGVGGISLIVVDQGIPGFTTKKLEKMGWHSSDTAEMFFDNVRVPASQLVGKEGQGFFYIMESFQLERLVSAILGISGAEDIIEITLKYMQERAAFGKPLAKFQVLRHKLVDIITEVEITRQFVYHCCWKQVNNIFAVKECSMAKMKATELCKIASDECLQIFGGNGYMAGYPIERAYRDARIGTIVAGTTEIMKEIIAKTVIDGVNYESTYASMKAASDAIPEPAPAAVPKAQTTPQSIPNNNKNQTTQTMATTAKEILFSLPGRLKTDKVDDSTSGVFHFLMEGEGDYTITLKDKAVTVEDGLVGTPTCEVRAKASDYVDIETGKTNPQMAFMMGKIKITNLGEMMKFMGLFAKYEDAA